MGHRIRRVEYGVYHVQLFGPMSKQAMLQYRHDLHNAALKHHEAVIAVIFTYGVLDVFDGEKPEQESIKEFLIEHPTEYRYSIHCGVNSFAKVALMFYHRVYNQSLPPDYYVKTMQDAIKLAISLRDKVNV
jgi:hypothetical protein